MPPRLRHQAILEKIVDVMTDGEPRTVRRLSYLINVSPTSVRLAVTAGLLVKVGMEPPVHGARRGSTIVQIASDTSHPPPRQLKLDLGKK